VRCDANAIAVALTRSRIGCVISVRELERMKVYSDLWRSMHSLFEYPFEVELHRVRQRDDADQLPTVFSERVQFTLAER
jgi:hypothetical protein